MWEKGGGTWGDGFAALIGSPGAVPDWGMDPQRGPLAAVARGGGG
jgi:hypothetical protein